jgi:hypothetical protein
MTRLGEENSREILPEKVRRQKPTATPGWIVGVAELGRSNAAPLHGKKRSVAPLMTQTQNDGSAGLKRTT